MCLHTKVSVPIISSPVTNHVMHQRAVDAKPQTEVQKCLFVSSFSRICINLHNYQNIVILISSEKNSVAGDYSMYAY
jgi:hypothetical protein